MIKPTVGRVVLYYPGGDHRDRYGAGPLAAIVAFVHTDRLINVGALNPDGRNFGVQNVPLLQGDDAAPEGGGYCAWMDYQKGQAAKAEKLEQQLAGNTPTPAPAPAPEAAPAAPAVPA